MNNNPCQKGRRRLQSLYWSNAIRADCWQLIMSWSLAVHPVFTRTPYKYCSPTFCQCMYCALKALSALSKFRGDGLTFQGKEIWVLLFRVKASRDLKTLPLGLQNFIILYPQHPSCTYNIQRPPCKDAQLCQHIWAFPFSWEDLLCMKKLNVPGNIK